MLSSYSFLKSFSNMPLPKQFPLPLPGSFLGVLVVYNMWRLNSNVDSDRSCCL